MIYTIAHHFLCLMCIAILEQCSKHIQYSGRLKNVQLDVFNDY